MPRNGFTLVELMVVIAMMALMAGAVVMTTGTPGAGPSADATRFASRAAAARDEAIIDGRPISAWVTPSGYGFERFEGGRWQKMSAKPFEGDNWDRGSVVALSAGAEGRARVQFDSLGLADSPATVKLTRDQRTIEVRIALNGDVTVE